MDEKQLCHRLPAAFVASILADFNAGRCDATSACSRLEINRSQLYALRHRWLSDPGAFPPLPSGGDHAAPWPTQAAQFAREFLPHCRPLNFALLADELARRLDFHRSRAAVAAWCRLHLPALAAPAPKPGPKPRRRWQADSIGELWQHDSSPHDWWPAATKPILLLTLDDHSRKIVAGSFEPSETTWAHFGFAHAARPGHRPPRRPGPARQGQNQTPLRHFSNPPRLPAARRRPPSAICTSPSTSSAAARPTTPSSSSAAADPSLPRSSKPSPSSSTPIASSGSSLIRLCLQPSPGPPSSLTTPSEITVRFRAAPDTLRIEACHLLWRF